eukprot:scaffold223_cov96-Skeletonema_dohrnii-CCMP3373.AAC.7
MMLNRSLLLLSIISVSWAFNIASTSSSHTKQHLSDDSVPDSPTVHNRREFFGSILAASTILTSSAAIAADGGSGAVITDKIYVEFKGIANNNAADATPTKDRIVIGLYGNDAPQPVSILKQLVTKQGYRSKCKQLDTTRLLQKEQLEANKVYNACLENEDTAGVNYDYSSVWRILKDQRIDVGAVSGKFVARENPNFEAKNNLSHDYGAVSVRRGDDGGYGFTIFPGTKGSAAAAVLDEDNIVVGRVLEGMDVVDRLNDMPVVKSSSLNYMALTGGAKGTVAPSRACRYGGPMYCNENKPLRKVLIESTGTL